MNNFNFKTINKKETLRESDSGIEKIDMLSTVVEIVNKDEIPIIGQILMDPNTLTRLDIIINHFWGTSDELDLLLKFNEIDDPFSVPVGKIIYIPDRFALESHIQIRKLVEPSSNSIVKQNNVNKLAATAGLPYVSDKADNITLDAPETAAQKRSILSGRGNGPRVTVPGVIKF